jgi:hypothetical protein
MNKLLILSPLLLAACGQHIDPCVVHKPYKCDPRLEVCVCEDRNNDSLVSPSPVVVPDPDDGVDNGGSTGDVDEDNGNDPPVSDDTNGDKTSDKSEDSPSNSNDSNSSSSNDSNGDNSDD